MRFIIKLWVIVLLQAFYMPAYGQANQSGVYKNHFVELPLASTTLNNGFNKTEYAAGQSKRNHKKGEKIAVGIIGATLLIGVPLLAGGAAADAPVGTGVGLIVLSLLSTNGSNRSNNSMYFVMAGMSAIGLYDIIDSGEEGKERRAAITSGGLALTWLVGGLINNGGNAGFRSNGNKRVNYNVSLTPNAAGISVTIKF